jgi:hypothetical protein
MIRSILAVVAGLVLSFAIVVLVQGLSAILYPLPPGVDVNDPASLRAAMADVPAGALFLVALAWFVGTFAGAWVAARVALRAPSAHAFAVGGILTLAGVANLLMLPHPAWFWVLGLSAAVLGAHLAPPAKSPAVAA